MGGVLHHTLQEDMEDCLFLSFDKACDKIYVFTVVTWARVSQKTNVQ